MTIILSLALATLNPAQTDRTLDLCAQQVGASGSTTRLSGLPMDVREEISRLKEIFGDKLADSDATLLQTDAPSAAERDHVMSRFKQAMLIEGTWFVQFEVAMMADVRTASFSRHPDNRFRYNPAHDFAGPACPSIKAALAGVRSTR